MKLMLAENIRKYRKERKMTQEKLAEALGVTVGAVYKWESGLSCPELNLLVEIADFFDTSVDVLLGYKMKDNRIDSTLERLTDYCRTLDQEGLVEAEKALGRYPHSFPIVYSCAKIYLAFGAVGHNTRYLYRALELLERSIVLFSQNQEPRINEAVIYGEMAAVMLLMGKKDRGIELLKQNNAGGMFSGRIGTGLAIYSDQVQEAVPFLSETFLDGISKLLAGIIGYVFVFRSYEDWDSAIQLLTWGTQILTISKMNDRPDTFDKAKAELFTLLAYVEWKAGKKEESNHSLEEAEAYASRFDGSPNYSMNTLSFVDNSEQNIVFDIFGASAFDSIMQIINLLEEPLFLEKWKETIQHEQHN